MPVNETTVSRRFGEVYLIAGPRRRWKGAPTSVLLPLGAARAFAKLYFIVISGLLVDVALLPGYHAAR
jgi:hypothetical protein